MKTPRIVTFFVVALLGFALQAQAVPVLQVGVPGGSGEGIYGTYVPSSSAPSETDTALTTGSLLYVAGTYKQNTLLLGGAYSTTSKDWSGFGLPTDFNGRGVVLVASVANGSSGSLLVNGASPFYSSPTNSYFPNEHDPVKENISDFLFFDLGNFANLTSPGVPDFAVETGSATGEIKQLIIAILGYEWVHFDVMALETDEQGNSRIVTTLENNPGSHDVTWKQPIPEPGTMMLVGIGLTGLAIYTKRRRN